MACKSLPRGRATETQKPGLYGKPGFHSGGGRPAGGDRGEATSPAAGLFPVLVFLRPLQQKGHEGHRGKGAVHQGHHQVEG